MSKLSLISQALYLCLKARSSLDDLPSQADESFQFKQCLRDVSACPLNPSASAVGNITVIYPCPLTTGNLCAPYSSMVFAGHHAANEVTRNGGQCGSSRKCTAGQIDYSMGNLYVPELRARQRWKTVFLLMLWLKRRHCWQKSLGWWAPGRVQLLRTVGFSHCQNVCFSGEKAYSDPPRRSTLELVPEELDWVRACTKEGFYLAFLIKRSKKICWG